MKKRKFDFHLRTHMEGIPVSIVNDAAVGSISVADGRLLPLVIIDCVLRPDIANLIELHSSLESGDVTSAWYKPEQGKDNVGLLLQFERPSRCVILIEFDILVQGGTVDAIVRNQGMYLQCGQEGDRLITTPGANRILIEIPSRQFMSEWNKLFLHSVENLFRNQGFKRHEARLMAEKHVAQWRMFTAKRLQSP